eukprot:767949-Hanusia_phi.AAC.3
MSNVFVAENTQNSMKEPEKAENPPEQKNPDRFYLRLIGTNDLSYLFSDEKKAQSGGCCGCL